MWMRCRLGVAKKIPDTEPQLKLLALIIDYFKAIEYWHDEDSGHWEETPKVEASSIGAVLAGIREFKKFSRKCMALSFFTNTSLKTLEKKGTDALNAILPNECIQPGKERDVDAALFFLIYPLQIVDDAMANEILERASD